MTDLEITKLCKEAMKWYDGRPFTPLTDDAQAMALVKKMELKLYSSVVHNCWVVESRYFLVKSDDLNRAICECVAKMQAAKVAR